MEKKELLEEFFAKYGSIVKRLDLDGQTRGVLAPTKEIDSKTRTITFETIGFSPKSEFVLLSPENNPAVARNARLQIDGKIYKVVECDLCIVAGEPFYSRAYLFEIRSVCV